MHYRSRTTKILMLRPESNGGATLIIFILPSSTFCQGFPDNKMARRTRGMKIRRSTKVEARVPITECLQRALSGSSKCLCTLLWIHSVASSTSTPTRSLKLTGSSPASRAFHEPVAPPARASPGTYPLDGIGTIIGSEGRERAPATSSSAPPSRPSFAHSRPLPVLADPTDQNKHDFPDHPPSCPIPTPSPPSYCTSSRRASHRSSVSHRTFLIGNISHSVQSFVVAIAFYP